MVEEVDADAVMGRGIGRAVRADEAFGLGRHAPDVGEHPRPHAEHRLGLVGQRRRLPLVEVADRGETDIVVIGPGKLGETGEVAPSHSSASHDGDVDQLTHERILPS